MTDLAILTSPQFLHQLPSLLVVQIDKPIFAGGDEVVTIGFVVTAKQLLVISWLWNLVQLLARSGVVVREGSICVGSDHDVFRDAGRVEGAPPKSLNLEAYLMPVQGRTSSISWLRR